MEVTSTWEQLVVNTSEWDVCASQTLEIQILSDLCPPNNVIEYTFLTYSDTDVSFRYNLEFRIKFIVLVRIYGHWTIVG